MQRIFNKTFSRLNKLFLHFPSTFCTHDRIICYSGLTDGSVIHILFIDAACKNNVGFMHLSLIFYSYFFWLFLYEIKYSYCLNQRKNGRILSVRQHQPQYLCWMVTQNMLQTNEKKSFLKKKKNDLLSIEKNALNRSNTRDNSLCAHIFLSYHHISTFD